MGVVAGVLLGMAARSSGADTWLSFFGGVILQVIIQKYFYM
jgi:hypothetical protein